MRSTIEAPPRTPLAQFAVAAVCLIVATLLRMALAVWVSGGLPYITYFPALAVAGAFGGRTSGGLCLLGSAILGLFAFSGSGPHAPSLEAWIGVAAFLLSGGLIVWLCDVLAKTVRALGEANAQEHLLALELQHRVKNTLAIVQAIAHQTVATRSGPSFRAAFTDRLVALGQAHNMLSETAWRSVDLEALIRRSLGPFVPNPRRLRLDGPPLPVSADQVVDLALCLHELGANATKYGALSVPGGHVEIRWAEVDPRRVQLRWSEHGGPVVSAPSHRGFGSRLLARGPGRNGNQTVAVEYRPEGLRWTAHFDIGTAG